MENYDIYLYGMILMTNSFLLKGDYPSADKYGEIAKRYVLPGGETGTCATVLASLLCQVKMDGTYMGFGTYKGITEFYRDKSVDISRLYLDHCFEGLEDYVMIDKSSRTPFGMFGQYFSNPVKRWNEPKEEDIQACKVAGIDPFFQKESEKAVELCLKYKKPFVVIDAPYDSIFNESCNIHAISTEFLTSEYPETDQNVLFEEYTKRSNGLIIFTHGAKNIMYGRKHEAVNYFLPYQINVVSTLGAGDTFKAGCIYALLHHMNDAETVSFASAAAACACMEFPLPLNPPVLGNIQKLRNQEK